MQKVARGIVAAGLVAGLVVACGGGGGGGNFAGIDRLGVTTGTINGFGSIIVNGVEYSTTGAAFDIDDSGSGIQADLQVGQQVTIQWSSTDDGVTRRAVTVAYDDTVEGPIASIDLLTQSLVVLGQVVLVDGATSFDDGISPRDLTGLNVGQFVEVSGLIDGNGDVRATRIEQVNQGDDDLEVRGIVSAVTATTFNIKALVINYATATLSDFPGGQIAEGDFVEAKGALVNSSNQLVATEVELEDNDLPGADDGDDGEVEGYITRYVSPTNFDVAGVPVTTNGQTVYDPEDGAFDPIAANNVNIKVEVEGEVNTSGVLVARKVEFKSGDSDDDGDDDSIDGRVAANVTAVTASTLTLAGVTVTVTPTTRFEDQTGVVDQTFGLGDITVGNYVEVRGTPGDGATLTAVIVERDDDGDGNLEGLLRGPVTLIANPNLSVLGVPVITGGGTQFRDSADNAFPDAAAFFAAISDGSEVQVQFTQGGGTIVADEIELED